MSTNLRSMSYQSCSFCRCVCSHTITIRRTLDRRRITEKICHACASAYGYKIPEVPFPSTLATAAQ